MKKKGRKLWIGIGVLIILVIGFLFYNSSVNFEKEVSQTIGSGYDYYYAVDRNIDTSYKGSINNKEANLVFKFKDGILLEKISFIVGSPENKEVSYLFTIRISDDGQMWQELVPTDMTKGFKGIEKFDYEFEPTRTYFINIVSKVAFDVAPFNIYEVELQTQAI